MRIRRITAIALVALSIAACGGDDDIAGEPAADAAGSSAVVTIHTFNFQPDPIEVEAGTTITFENEDKINHSVTSGTRETPTPDAFDEGVMDGAGESFELTLTEPGTYDYFCKFHPGEGMTG
jgi:plastocyanin